MSEDKGLIISFLSCLFGLYLLEVFQLIYCLKDHLVTLAVCIPE
jgi:hypothetical protein